MGITGSQKALMAARAGIARSGATRSGYLTNYDAVLAIEVDGVLTDLSPYIRHGTLHVSQSINDDVDTASFTLIPQTPVVPSVRSRVRIGSGASLPGQNEFAGQIMSVTCEQFAGPDRRPFVHVTCVDDLAVFDAHLVTDVWPYQGAATTIRDLVARYTRGGFDTSAVAGMDNVDGIAVANERPSTIMRRLTSAIGGGFRIEDRRVYAWGAPYYDDASGTPPQPLVDGLHSLKSFARTRDGSQQRTVVFVEGARTSTLVSVGAWPDYLPWVAVEDASMFVVPAPGAFNFARLGTQIVTYEDVVDVVPHGTPPLTTKATAAAVAGASAMAIATAPVGWPVNGWARVGNQVVAYTLAAPTTLQIHSWGSLMGPVAVDDSVVALDCLMFMRGYTRDTTTSGGSFYGWVSAPLRAQPQGMEVVLLRAALDATAAADIAEREASDGYIDHVVSDGRYSSATSSARALSEFDQFKGATVSYDWSTDDVNAKAGKMQAINLTERDELVVDDVRIQSVEIEWLGKDILPRRRCTATRVKPVGVVDAWLTETD